MQRKGSIHAKVTEHLRTSHLVQKHPKVGNNGKHRALLRAVGVWGGSRLFWRGLEGCDARAGPYGDGGWMHRPETFVTPQHDGENQKKIPKERKRGNVWMAESGTERHMTARKVRRGRCKKKHSVISELEESGCHGRAAPSACAERAAVFPCTHFPTLF